jgi:hypothetical protein
MAKMGKPRGNYQKFNAIYNEELVPSKIKNIFMKGMDISS